MILNLKAQTNNERIILNYLTQNASDVLAEKINNGKKTLKGCWSYIVSEARKIAENNCACVDDKTVFGWAVHYFEEDTILEKQGKSTPAAKTSTTVVKKDIKKDDKTDSQALQLSLFDM